jgi:4-hydroxy-2-oxoheptanedioate aldolase
METVEGVEAIEEIAKMPGCDGFYVGPTDLGISMGLKPELDCKDPKHAVLVQRVIDVTKAHGLNVGIHVTGPEEGMRRWKQGFNLNPIANDIWLLTAGATKNVSDFKNGLGL